ncbi:GNAT family N-acetyltransferase [Phenylobacterium deserti]|uniref:N-acetyltransferase n=1 Tax=Phenylobacterium deserti TaxID=1914756 RepID=A0A328AR05_9CAUL|nr:GNAT family N-acetyltransferase [Phenylobacterium deserti]RAK57019.1 N-acetyltransferase [Phenylobacterium deserti]
MSARSNLALAWTFRVDIFDFRPEYGPAFKALNEAWITRYFALETKDVETLADPQGKIVDRGGRIFMALESGEAVGCVAMIAMDDGGYEVAKMAVDESVQGRGVGRALLQKCIDQARALAAPRLYIETNSKLTPAVSLYRSMGFKDLAPAATPYARCDTWMELKLR